MKKPDSNPVEKSVKLHEVKVRRESNSGRTHVIITVIISVILLITIFFAQSAFDLLSTKFNLQVDMTKNKIFTMSEATKTFVESINKKVDIVVLENENSFKADFPQQLEIIQSYAKNNPEYFTYSYVDVVYDPAYLNPYQRQHPRRQG